MQQPEDILTATSLFHKLYRFYGFNAYTIKGQPKMKQVKICRLLYVATFAAQVALVLFCLTYYQTRFFYLYQFAADTKFSLVNVIYGAVDVCHFCIIILYEKMQTPETVKFWQTLQTRENELEKRGIKLNYAYLRNYTLLVTIYEFVVTNLTLLVIAIAVLAYNVPFLDPTMYWAMFFTLYYSSIANSNLFNSVFVSFGVLAHMFEKLQAYVETQQIWDAKKLLRISKQHQLLCDLARKTNQKFSIQFLSMYIHAFIVLTVRLFDTTLALAKLEFNWSVALTLAFTAVAITIQFALIHVCHRCMAAVSVLKSD